MRVMNWTAEVSERHLRGYGDWAPHVVLSLNGHEVLVWPMDAGDHYQYENRSQSILDEVVAAKFAELLAPRWDLTP